MSGHPTREERALWAELRGDQRRPTRRWAARLVLVGALAAVVAVPLVLADDAGYLGCGSDEDRIAFWALPASQVTPAQRDRELARTERCVDFLGLTRNEVMERMGVWTSVKEYPRTAAAKKGTYLVWSNGSDTEGIGVEFTGPRGHAVSVERYIP